MIEKYKKILEDTKIRYEKKVEQKRMIEEASLKLLKKIDELKEESNKSMLIREILSESSKEARRNGGHLLSDMTTRILQMGFEEDVSMKVLLDERKNPATAEIEIVSEHTEGSIENDPEFDGGGLADTVAISSLEAFNFIQKSNKAPLMFDEPTSNVSAGYSKGVSRALYAMSHSLGKQTLLITHDTHLIEMGDEGFLIDMDEFRRTTVKKKSEITKIN